MGKEPIFEGYMTAINEFNKCARCGSPDVVVVLKIDDVIKGLKVEKCYPSCRKCCEETGVDLSVIPQPERRVVKTNKEGVNGKMSSVR
jgi:hypothetical protein